MTADIVTDADDGLVRRKPGRGVIFHGGAVANYASRH